MRIIIKKFLLSSWISFSILNPGPVFASGYCFQPSAPSFYISKPRKPFCATSRSCTQWDVDSYKSELERYFEKLKKYAEDVDKFHEDAQRYIECMIEVD